MRELRAEDPGAERWLMIPEAAPCLFRIGFDAHDKRFQRAVVRLQTGLEEACAVAAGPGQIHMCHRGTLDTLAYWLHRGWEKDEFFDSTRMSLDDHLDRYVGVMHLQTAAVGAKRHYFRWPDAHRPETLEQAQEIDHLCGKAWGGHPRYVLIENAGMEWEDKARLARDVLARWVHANPTDRSKEPK
jgi:hypothetical protein